MMQTASVAGPALGGLMIATTSIGWAYVANAVSFGFVILALVAMRLSFLEGADLGELEVVLEAGRRAGEDAEELREAIQQQDVKDALRGANDEALALGVFGVPTVVVGERAFWGDDRLEQAAEARQRLDP